LKYLELKKIPDLSMFYDTLEELYIGDNELDYLPDLSMFKKLLVLDVSINKIKKISKLPKNLIEFTCFDNYIDDISSIKHCPNLKTLYASNNLISDISFLNNKLNVLIMNNNNLSSIPNNLTNIRKIQH
jgi:Leucine-rich repeat (LRR) protein